MDGDGHMNRDLFYGLSEQTKAGKHRMDDALTLLNAVRWRGAMYMAGYSVECLLKSKLMHMFRCGICASWKKNFKPREFLRSRRPFLPISWNRCCD